MNKEAQQDLDEDIDLVTNDPDDGLAYDPEEDPFYEEDLADEGDLDFEPDYNDY